MSKFKSKLAPLLDKFVTYRNAIGQWNISYEKVLKSFDLYCLDHGQTTEVVNQELVYGWSTKHEKESQNTFYKRLLPLCAFLRYLSERNLSSVMPPELPRFIKKLPPPHPLREDDLKRFFSICDSEECCRGVLSQSVKATRRLTIPVFMRFQYSTGMRPGATLHLHRHDVDLKTGVVNVAEDKGHNQHYIVLHDSMLGLLQQYDREIDLLQPDRTYFFESPYGGAYNFNWGTKCFRILWARANGKGSGIRLYDLRHNYATQNMLRIKGDSNMLDKLSYLSMSMGHNSINSTIRYADLSPQLANKIREVAGETFDRIVPEVNHEVK